MLKVPITIPATIRGLNKRSCCWRSFVMWFQYTDLSFNLFFPLMEECMRSWDMIRLSLIDRNETRQNLVYAVNILHFLIAVRNFYSAFMFFDPRDPN